MRPIQGLRLSRELDTQTLQSLETEVCFILFNPAISNRKLAKDQTDTSGSNLKADSHIVDSIS
jgi:hypothetical protein